MRFFTRDWHSGDLTESETEAIRQSYWDAVSQMRSLLPPTVNTLVDTSLHDGLIKRIILDHESNCLSLELRCGDLAEGYFDLDLTYQNPLFLTGSFKGLARVANNPESQLLYDEVDKEPDALIHRLLFWPYAEFDLRFTDLELSRCTVAGRTIPVLSERAVELNRPAI